MRAEHPWIELVRMPERRERHFAGKVHAFNAGYARVRIWSTKLSATWTATSRLTKTTFLSCLASWLRIRLWDWSERRSRIATIQTYDYRFVGIEHVSGACQLFRRECFEEIGGYVPVKGGGVDHIAVITARMKGWKTRTFTEKVCLHHRAMGTAQHGVLRASLEKALRTTFLEAIRSGSCSGRPIR